MPALGDQSSAEQLTTFVPGHQSGASAKQTPHGVPGELLASEESLRAGEHQRHKEQGVYDHAKLWQLQINPRAQLENGLGENLRIEKKR